MEGWSWRNRGGQGHLTELEGEVPGEVFIQGGGGSEREHWETVWSLFSLIVPLKLVAQGRLPCHHLLLTFVHELDFSMGFFSFIFSSDFLEGSIRW